MNRSSLLAALALVGVACHPAPPAPATRDVTRAADAASGAAAAPRPRTSVAPCLAYEDTIAVAGRLARRTFPGAPNFERIAAGDEPETGFYLDLAAPICARTSRPNADDGSVEARDDVRTIQLVLDSAGYRRLAPALGQAVALRGTLFSSFTGHHHAPLLLRPIMP